MEIFDANLLPALSVFCGDTIPNHELSAAAMAQLPVGIDVSMPGYIPTGGADYRAMPELGEAIARQVMADSFDVTILRSMPKLRTPHAYGFVYRRIMRDRPIPSVPVVLNTFYPPNQPSVRRCADLGRSILRAIEQWDKDLRVAVIASGGLTHFVIDEEFDRLFLDAMREHDVSRIARLDEKLLQDGTSEVKNWVPLVVMMSALGLKPNVVDYVPIYRSEAGTGNAMGFVEWRA
jgi:3-O-methylgallate 3,4-dioxygenase